MESIPSHVAASRQAAPVGVDCASDRAVTPALLDERREPLQPAADTKRRPAAAARRRSAGCSRPRSRAPGGRRTAPAGWMLMSSARSTLHRSRRRPSQLGVERGFPPLISPRERVPEELTPVGEVVVDERLRDARLGRNRRHAQAVRAVANDDTAGRLEDLDDPVAGGGHGSHDEHLDPSDRLVEYFLTVRSVRRLMETLEPTRRPPPLPHPLDEGWTLPASWYSDEGVLELEREQIFASAWQYAGPAELVAEPESFMASVAGHIPVVVTRASDGELRGLVNVCRHRGHVVAQGCGSRATLQCPYHAWTYELDGSLRRAPRSDREAGFDRRRPLAATRCRSTRGARSSSSTRTSRRRRSRRPWAPCRRRSRAAGSISTASASTRTSRGSNRSTGRSRSRTTSSATTARSRIPGSAS